MTSVAEAITYERAIKAQARQIDGLHRKVEALKRENRDLRQAKLTELHDSGTLQEMLYPMEKRGSQA